MSAATGSYSETALTRQLAQLRLRDVPCVRLRSESFIGQWPFRDPAIVAWLQPESDDWPFRVVVTFSDGLTQPLTAIRFDASSYCKTNICGRSLESLMAGIEDAVLRELVTVEIRY